MKLRPSQLDIIQRCLRYSETIGMLDDIPREDLLELKNNLQVLMLDAAFELKLESENSGKKTEIIDDDAGNK